MSGRAVTLLAAATFVAIMGGGGGTIAGAAAKHGEISLSTDVVVPGQSLWVTGTGWPVGITLAASICGADAVSGTTDCAVTAAVTMTANAKGIVTARMTGVLPPQPCPCVVLVTGDTTQYSKRIPVTVVGASTAPVHPAPVTVQPDLQVANLQVAGGTTLASSLGAAAPRTVELRVHNAGSLPETPVLLGRWGSGTQVTNVIKMPVMPALGAGRSAEVRAPFWLPDFSMGRYTVRVEIEVVGFSHVVSASASTSTWPIALFVLGLVLLELIVLAITKAVRVRRRRAAREDSVAVPEEPSSDGAGKQPELENPLIALGTLIRQSGGGTADRPAEPYDANDPMSQLE